ncbi:Alpha/Beta hydrolase protein [Hygrophoropsis aurantiaca]|uniref:Alpha/Beta hydrolase protein n=1 Tax=Hygrophoropsis aurantiaca TaxID=72124 RepID=A0ACB8AFF0_9AGAM|nr:Alpha/Beta hydrolase protein [Hygrophoropsis aurantiaca]
MVNPTVVRSIINISTQVQLEIATSYPTIQSSKLAVCLHPWSWLGGNMNDYVIHSLVRLLQRKDYHVRYYNSRGVGKSTGSASFTGKPEADDLKALIDQSLDEMPHIDSVTVIGYSYGALIASLQPVLFRVKSTSHILLSYPLSPRGFLTMFNTKNYVSVLSSLLRDPNANVLVMFGEDDEFTSKTKYHAWVKSLEQQVLSGTTMKVVSVPGASHFWGSGEASRLLEETIGNWLQ